MRKGQAGIYCVLNQNDQKRYVGSSHTVKFRIDCHRTELRKGTHFNRHLQFAWNKCGESAFRFLVLEIVTDVLSTTELRSRLLTLEQKWIDHFRVCEDAFGYNAAPTAGSTLGVKYTEEGRANCGKHLKGKVLPDEHRKKILAALVTRSQDPAFRQKLKDARALKRLDPDYRERMAQRNREIASRPEVRAKLSLAAKGRKRSKAECAIISERNRRLWADPEQAAKRAAAIRLAKSTPECKARCSEAAKKAITPAMRKKRARTAKKQWASGSLKPQQHSLETRAKIGAALTGRVFSAETRQKMSESAKHRVRT